MRMLVLSALGSLPLLSACGRAAPPLTGAVTPVAIPRTELPPVHRSLVFRWSYTDYDFRLLGEGVARIAPPDSARLDFFLGGSEAGGYAILTGTDLRTPGGPLVRGLLPPVPLLWATLGRLAIPAAADTIVRIDGDTLRADIGRDPRWRAAFVSGELRRLEFIEVGRIQQFVVRSPEGVVRYEHATRGRRLELTVTRVDTVRAFDAKIWRD